MFLEQAVLFCAARTSPATAPSKPYIFQETTAIRGSSYNLNTGYFTPQTSGTYVLHVSSAIPAGTRILLNIEGGGLNAGIYRQTTSHNGWETTSRDVIYTFTQGTQVLLNLNEGSSTSDLLKQTSWSSFLLDNVMSPVIAFCAGRSYALTSTGKVDYTNTLVNVGNAWNPTIDTFIAPRSGIYVFSVSYGVQASQSCNLLIYVNDVMAYEMINTDTVHNGYDTLSRTFAVSLLVNNTVYAFLNNGVMYSDNAYQTSFAGFLYEPLNERKVIWSVYRTNTVNGQYNPFPFDAVDINIGNGWNSATNVFVAPYAGVYQLHLTATSYVGSHIDFRLYWNNVAYANINSTTTNYNGFITRSRAIMIDAAVGDIFFITTSSSTYLFSHSHKLISFTGFLISS